MALKVQPIMCAWTIYPIALQNTVQLSGQVINIIKNIQSGQAAGGYEVTGELLKAGVVALTVSILHLINAWWSSKTQPQDFKNAKLTTLYKNEGERGDCNNYCGLSLLSVTGKVFANVFLNRFQQFAEDLYPES